MNDESDQDGEHTKRRVYLLPGAIASRVGLLCMLIGLLVTAQAVYAATKADMPPHPRQLGWSVGPLVLAVDQPYRGNSARILAVPGIGYEGDSVFLRGLRFGVHLKSSRQLSADFVLQPRLASFKASENRDIPNLEDRRDSMDAGLNLRVALTGPDAIIVTALADVLGRSNGQELDVKYEYSLHYGGARTTPWIGVRGLSKKLADYYYGTLSSEVAAGAPDYRPGAAIVPQIGINVFSPIEHSRWSIFTLLAASLFPDTLSNSPLVDGDTAYIFIAGVFYHF